MGPAPSTQPPPLQTALQGILRYCCLSLKHWGVFREVPSACSSNGEPAHRPPPGLAPGVASQRGCTMPGCSRRAGAAGRSRMTHWRRQAAAAAGRGFRRADRHCVLRSPPLCPRLQAAKIIANLLVAGGTVLFRAASQAYRQAIISAWPLLPLPPLQHKPARAAACSAPTASGCRRTPPAHLPAA